MNANMYISIIKNRASTFFFSRETLFEMAMIAIDLIHCLKEWFSRCKMVKKKTIVDWMHFNHWTYHKIHYQVYWANRLQCIVCHSPPIGLTTYGQRVRKTIWCVHFFFEIPDRHLVWWIIFVVIGKFTMPMPLTVLEPTFKKVLNV